MNKKMLLVLLTALISFGMYARTIKIHGQVTMKDSGEPASGVTIYDAAKNKFLGITGDQGRFSITADSEDKLIFTGQSYLEHYEDVGGRLIINVQIGSDISQLEEVVVSAKAPSRKLGVESADFDVEGNYLKIKSRVKIPKKLFGSSKRFVIQPFILNVTQKKVFYLSPLVIDGERYAITQRRMYDRSGTGDTLLPYEQIRHIGSGKDDGVIFIRDSLYVRNPNEDFLSAVLSSLESYNSILYNDSIQLKRGTTNPLRFLAMNLKPMVMDEDEFKPVEEVELRDTEGEVKFNFHVGKSNLDLSLGNNQAELDRMLTEFKAIENDPSMTLKGFSIMGYASPEGREVSNRNLSRARMNSAMSTIMSNVNPTLTRNAHISSDADISPWSDIVTMLVNDSLFAEADKLQAVIDKNRTLDAQSYAAVRLPFYKTLLREKYLPRLRRVNYHIITSSYRPLTDDEIVEVYETNPKSMSRYQFYRYYNMQTGDKREEAIRKALEVHPDFVAASTDLSTLMLERRQNPMNILKPYFEPGQQRRLPVAMIYNMAIACMDSAMYDKADALLARIPDTEATHKAKIYSTALNGGYREVIEEVSRDSQLNEVLLLLAMKDNQSAARSARNLGNSAVEEYVKAIVANRLDNYAEAIIHLNNAFALDPSLIAIAKIDADVNDLVDEDEEYPLPPSDSENNDETQTPLNPTSTDE